MKSMAGRIRDSASVLWQDRHDVAWAAHVRVDSAYLGWLGRGNLGDEVMYAALAARWAPATLRPAPLHRVSRRLARGTRVGTLTLGGGTLLGRDEWAARLDALLVATRVERLIVLGTGCEDLERALELGVATPAGLRRWSELLSHADYIGVRGPASQEALAELGIRSEVLGDPALLVDRLPRDETKSRQVVGLSVAAVRDGLGADRQLQLAIVRDAVRRIEAEGFDPVWFCMESKDEPLSRSLARDSGGRVRPYEPNIGNLLAFIGSCAAVMSERLHGGILGLAVGTPSVMLGYKPKCVDFARSVGAEDAVVDLEACDPDELAARVVRAARSALPESVGHAVDDLRVGLAARVDEEAHR